MSAIVLGWHDDQQTILRADFSQDWTWEEFVNTYDQIMIMTRGAAPRRIDLILVNGAKYFRVPPGNPWPAVRRLAASIPENAGIQVQVGGTRTSVIFQNMQRYFSQEAAARTFFAETLDEALSVIADMRERQIVTHAVP